MTKNTDQKIPSQFDISSPEFDLFSSPFYLIAHADFKYHEDLDIAITKYGLDRTTYRLLTILMRKSPINIKDLSVKAMAKRSTVSRAITRMKNEGLVDQQLDENDNRISNVELTEHGREMAEKVIQLGSRQIRRALNGLNEEQLTDLQNTLKHIVQNLSKLSIEE